MFPFLTRVSRVFACRRVHNTLHVHASKMHAFLYMQGTQVQGPRCTHLNNLFLTLARLLTKGTCVFVCVWSDSFNDVLHVQRQCVTSAKFHCLSALVNRKRTRLIMSNSGIPALKSTFRCVHNPVCFFGVLNHEELDHAVIKTLPGYLFGHSSRLCNETTKIRAMPQWSQLGCTIATRLQACKMVQLIPILSLSRSFMSPQNQSEHTALTANEVQCEILSSNCLYVPPWYVQVMDCNMYVQDKKFFSAPFEVLKWYQQL